VFYSKSATKKILGQTSNIQVFVLQDERNSPIPKTIKKKQVHQNSTPTIVKAKHKLKSKH
jgi:hypothetical protein